MDIPTSAIIIVVLVLLVIIMLFFVLNSRNNERVATNELEQINTANKILEKNSIEQNNQINNLKSEISAYQNEVETLKEMIESIPKDGSKQLADIFGALSEQFNNAKCNLNKNNINSLPLILSQVEQDLNINIEKNKTSEYIKIPEFLKDQQQKPQEPYNE